VRRFLSILFWLIAFMCGTFAVLVIASPPNGMDEIVRQQFVWCSILIAAVCVYLSALLGYGTEEVR